MSPVLRRVLSVARHLCLPDWLVFSGAVYQPVLNHLTGCPLDYGIKDYDLAYFDASKRSYEAEDSVIRWVRAAFDEPLRSMVGGKRLATERRELERYPSRALSAFYQLPPVRSPFARPASYKRAADGVGPAASRSGVGALPGVARLRMYPARQRRLRHRCFTSRNGSRPRVHDCPISPSIRLRSRSWSCH